MKITLRDLLQIISKDTYVEIWVDHHPTCIDILVENARLLSDELLNLKVTHMHSLHNSGVMCITTTKG